MNEIHNLLRQLGPFDYSPSTDLSLSIRFLRFITLWSIAGNNFGTGEKKENKKKPKNGSYSGERKLFKKN